jgi:hypothetical protein
MMRTHSLSISVFQAGCLAAAVFLLPLCPQLHATLLVYESFDYAANGNLGGQNGGIGFSSAANGIWTDASQPGNEDLIRPGSLAYPGLQTAGNSLSMVSPTNILDPTSSRRLTTIKPAAGDSTWVSFLFALENTSAPLSSTDFACFTVSPSSGLGAGPFIGVFDDPNGAPGDKVFGIGSSQGTALSLSTVSLEEGQVYFLMARIDWVNGNETVTLYVNPAVGAEAGSLTPSAVTTALNVANGSNVNQMSAIGLFAGGVGTEWAFDEIRVGTTLADVAPIPEPSSLALVCLSGVGMLLRQRKSRS